jgi:hypothetical protein
MPWPRNGPGRSLRPEQPTCKPYRSTATADGSTTGSLPHRRDREARRLATIELTRLLYGPAADLRPTPPGPAVCPPTCRYCSRKRAA